MFKISSRILRLMFDMTCLLYLKNLVLHIIDNIFIKYSRRKGYIL